MTSGFMEGEYKKHHSEEHARVFSKLTVESIVRCAWRCQLYLHLTDKYRLAVR